MEGRLVITDEMLAALPAAAMAVFDALPMEVRRTRIKAVVNDMGLSLSKRLWYELAGHSTLYELESFLHVFLMVQFRNVDEKDVFVRRLLEVE
jgi:hypothetical protein